MNPKISAVICTHNRAKYLKKAIKSLLDQTLPKKQYEIIIIDNKSTDNTKQTAQEFSKNKNLRYIYEPKLGLSQARNTGWKKAKGKYIAYLDDDAIASKQWLQKIIETFEKTKPLPGCVGGKVEPIWQSQKPKWIGRALLPQLTILDLSKKPIFLKENMWVVGANISIPKKILKEIGGFPINLGRKGKNLNSGEDEYISQKIREKGCGIFYHPNISVKHLVPLDRLTQKWFIKRFYWQGVSNAIIYKNLKHYPPIKNFWEGTKIISQLFLRPIFLYSVLVPTENPDYFYRKCKARAWIGFSFTMFGLIRMKYD